MKKYAFAISLILINAWIGLAAARHEANPAAQNDTKMVSGAVLTISAGANEIVIKDDTGTEVHVAVSKSTKITRGGKTISLADVKAGEMITSECQMSSDGGCLAKSITVSAAKSSQ